MEENKPITPGIIPLAYMGDVLYEVAVREKIIRDKSTSKVRELHREAVSYVRASAQAYAILTMMAEDYLTQEELAIVKRGRNQAVNAPKNADQSDYRYATGLEALIGHLYFKNEKQRMNEIIDRSMAILSSHIKNQAGGR